MLSTQTLGQFSDAVAAKIPAPGGGSVSAYASTLGAALGLMAARYTESPEAAAAAAALDKLRGELLSYVDRDSEAYGKVSAAFTLPKKTDEEKAARKSAVQAALHGAGLVPLEAMRLAVAALRELDRYASGCNKNLVSDLSGGALLLAAGLEGCSHNVEVNAASIVDAAKSGGLRKECATLLAEGKGLAASVQAKAARVLHPA